MEKIIREANLNDSIAIWKIRNHPTSRIWFNFQEEIEFDDHNEWFQNKYINSGDDKCFVLQLNSDVIGYCRFDLKDGEYLVSIAIDPEYRGQGFGNELLAGAIKLFRDSGYKSHAIVAEVKLSNLSSSKIFEKCNFVKYKDDADKIYLKLA